MLEAENKALKAQRDQSKKRKGVVVETDLNKVFVSIRNVRRTRTQVEPSESEDSE